MISKELFIEKYLRIVYSVRKMGKWRRKEDVSGLQNYLQADEQYLNVMTLINRKENPAKT